MRIRNLRKRVAQVIVAAGCMLPCVVAEAESLNMELVVDGSFENTAQPGGPYGSLTLSDWTDTGSNGSTDNFAYAHSQNYAGVPAPAGAGNFYFTGGFTAGPDPVARVSQNIDVSTGDTAAAIANGSATYDFSAFFSGYRGQSDFSGARVRFLDGSNVDLGVSADIGGNAARGAASGNGSPLWTQDTAAGMVPVGTAFVDVELFAAEAGGGNFDGYVDLVSLKIDGNVTAVPEPASLGIWSLLGVFAGLFGWRRWAKSKKDS